MSKSKINILITSSVMTAVCLAGMSNVSVAIDLPETDIQAKSLTAVSNQSSHSSLAPLNAEGQRRYIVRLKEPAVAQYNGTGTFVAIPRDPDNKIIGDSLAVVSYVDHLKQVQNTFLAGLTTKFGRQVDALLSYQYSINGFALNLTAEEANVVQRDAAVSHVEIDRNYKLDTDAGPILIGANNVWTGMSPSSGTALGEGVVIGTLDSGINFDHPSFADVGGDAYDHTNPLGSGNYLGVCDPSNVDQYIDTYVCNDKLIGGFDFINALTPVGDFDIPGPEDEDGHGTHTSSTSGGNVVLTAAANGVENIEISGVAPHATLIHFDVCFSPADPNDGGCAGASSIASVDQAIADGLVDVINYSISGGTSPWTDAVSQAFLSATDSGIFVSASAGNSGPGPGTLSHVEPWTSSVGASTHSRRFETFLSITGPGTPDPALVDIEYVTSNGPTFAAPIVGGINYAGEVDPANVEGCVAFPAASFDGLVALISRGTCAFADKVANATAAGAVAVIVHNDDRAVAFGMNVGDATTIPSISVPQADGLAMADFIANNASPTVEIVNPIYLLDGQADSMAGFSSRGPSPFEYNKPDVTGPGVRILAAFNDNEVVPGVGDEYGIISGTSMSSPHNAGSAALLKELHPTWTAAEIKSALMLTAVTAGVTKEDGVTPSDPYDRGAGRIQVDVASSTGMVMDETAFRFLLADPANGGDPKTLNTASYKNNNCVGTCSFQRKFTSVAAGPVDYEASLSGMTGTVNPASFTALPGQTVTIDVEIDAAALVPGATSFGELQLTPQAGPPTGFTVNPSVAITDEGYTSPTAGTAGMVCEDIVVAGLDSGAFASSVVMSMSHNNWLADLTVKLANPNGDLLTILNESSAGGGITLDSSIPINFFDGAAASADTLGSDGGAFGGDPACTTDPCEFFPFANNEASPPATFADLSVGDPNGTWQICAGDSASGDTGILESATLNIAQAAPQPDLHMPLVVVGFPEAPEIDVTPTSLAATLNTGETVDLTLNIANDINAGTPLTWALDTTSATNITDQVIYEQLETAVVPRNGIVSDVFVDGVTDPGAYTAETFTLAADTDVDGFFFDGFVSNGDLSLSDEIESFTVTVYADAAGVPAGNPEDGGGTELFTVTVPVGDMNLDLGDDSGPLSVNVKNATGSSWSMTAGTYWVTGYANFIGANRWNWFTGVPGDAVLPHLIDPQDLFGGGFTDWTDLLTLVAGDVDYSGLAFNVKTLIGCGAPWITYSSTNGSVAIGANEDVTVTLDSTGVAAGVYEGAVCVVSDDIDESFVVVPVTLTVDGPTDLIFMNGFE